MSLVQFCQFQAKLKIVGMIFSGTGDRLSVNASYGYRHRMIAVVGPCISQDSYEVGAVFPQPFQAQDTANDRFFAPGRRDGHLQFDLAGYVLSRLAAAGGARSSALGADTYADDDLFSYRRTCHRGEPDYGRNLSVIALAEAS